jgi:CBS domain-containing protein
MTTCPDCGHANIPGADLCEQCQQSLVDKPRPGSAIERALLEDSIRKLNPKKPLTVAPDTPIGQVLGILVRNSIGCVLVVKDDQVLGIFSERDVLLRLNVDAADLSDRPVSDFMTPSPEMLQTGDKIAFAIHRMDVGGFRHIPILADGRAVGIISIRDILDYMTARISDAQPA